MNGQRGSCALRTCGWKTRLRCQMQKIRKTFPLMTFTTLTVTSEVHQERPQLLVQGRGLRRLPPARLLKPAQSLQLELERNSKPSLWTTHTLVASLPPRKIV